MKLLAITDLHGDRGALAKILAAANSPDAILLGGDVTHFGSGNEAAGIVQQCRDVCPHVFAVAGNCDSPEIDRVFSRLGVGLMGCGAAHQDAGFYGLSAMPVWRGNFYELTEEEIADALERGWAELQSHEGLRFKVLVSHPPPRGVVDLTSGKQNVGSTALREHIERRRPALVVCGHIHEARGLGQVGESIIANCGPALRGCFAEIQLDEQVRVELLRAGN